LFCFVSRGQIVVIGATNRPDAVDPALRRPGRFDRELLFPLPDASARTAILDIHSASWNPPLPDATKEWVVQNSVGYCGADLKALCAEACLISLRRTFPQVYESSQRLELDVREIVLGRGDFAAALQRVVPASRRSNSAPGCPLEPMSAALLQPFLGRIVDKLGEVFPGFLLKSGGGDPRKRQKLLASGASASASASSSTEKEGDRMKALAGQTKRLDENDLWISCLTDVQDADIMRGLVGEEESLGLLLGKGAVMPTVSSSGSSLWSSASIVSRPRLMLFGNSSGMGQTELANAALHRLEEFPVFSLDFASLLADSSHFSPEQALVSRVMEASKAAPSVIFLPDLTSWWRSSSDGMRSALVAAAAGMNRSLPVLWLSTVSLGEQNAVDDEARLLWLLKWLSGASSIATTASSSSSSSQTINQRIENIVATAGGVVSVQRPSFECREKLFTDFFHQLHALPITIYAARKKMFLPKQNKLSIAAVAPEQEKESNASPEVKLNSTSHASLADLLHEPANPFAQQQDVSFIDVDEAKNYMRELRLFMRAALVEMFKEKKLSPLYRPVDPDNVPDYYDIVTAPMDLDTIRSKVDEDLYPTYRCFYYDLEQIGFNAQTYNPLDTKDVRGKQIVHSAKSLLDMVETHAYNFKNRLGYDLFKRCDVIASSPDLLRAVSSYAGELDTLVFARALDKRAKSKADIKRVRSVIPRENESLYKPLLDKHMEIKEEMGEDHPSFGTTESKLEKLASDINAYRNGSKGPTNAKDAKRFSSSSADDANRRRGRSDGCELLVRSLEDIESANRKRRKITAEATEANAESAAADNDSEHTELASASTPAPVPTKLAGSAGSEQAATRRSSRGSSMGSSPGTEVAMATAETLPGSAAVIAASPAAADVAAAVAAAADVAAAPVAAAAASAAAGAAAADVSEGITCVFCFFTFYCPLP
jgi:SpoVK/Ycf46/Vps4 family AAA+-type ATPase